jgi:hypothetical protein
MKKYGLLLPLVIFVTLAAAQAVASTPPKSLADNNKSSEPAAPPQLFKPAPAAPSTPDSRPKGHTFQVNDVKGLLLTCTAPELDTNPDTDIFNSCTLAPGRTLDDVMHTFIQAIHVMQNQQAKERAEHDKDLDENLAQRRAQK